MNQINEIMRNLLLKMIIFINGTHFLKILKLFMQHYYYQDILSIHIIILAYDLTIIILIIMIAIILIKIILMPMSIIHQVLINR